MEKPLAGELPGNDARAVLHVLTEYCSLKLMPLSELVPSALELAIKIGFTFYDSLYLALAVAANAMPVTADKIWLRWLINRYYSSRLSCSKMAPKYRFMFPTVPSSPLSL